MNEASGKRDWAKELVINIDVEPTRRLEGQSPLLAETLHEKMTRDTRDLYDGITIASEEEEQAE